MKKQGLSILVNLSSLAVLFLFFSSFTYLANHAAVVEQQSFWTTLQGFSLEKLGFWQKTTLVLGVSAGGYALFRRHYQRHYDEGVGCIGVLGIIILGAIVIALLPLLLIVGLVMLILGIPFPRYRRKGNRRRRW